MKAHALEIEPGALGSMCLLDLYFPAIEMKSSGVFQSTGTMCKDALCGYMGCNHSLTMNLPWPCQMGSETEILSWKWLMYHHPSTQQVLKNSKSQIWKSGDMIWEVMMQHFPTLSKRTLYWQKRESRKKNCKVKLDIFISLSIRIVLHSPLQADRPSQNIFESLSIQALIFCLHWSWI